MIDKIRGIIDEWSHKKIFFFLPLIILAVAVVAAVIVMFVIIIAGTTLSKNRVGVTQDSAYYEDSYAPSIARSTESFGLKNVSSIAPTDVGAGGTVSTAERKIVRNGSVDMLVKRVEDTAKSIQDLALNNEGLVEATNIYGGSKDTKTGYISIRIPNDKFDLVTEEIKKLAVKVNREQISSDDVTAQYVDLEARLKSRRAVEGQYVELLKKANKVDEIVLVHSYLNNVREEIERLQAQINYLARQVSMSTITVSMTSEAEVQVLGITWRPLTVVKQAFKSLLEDLTGIVDWIIVFIFKLPGFFVKLGIFVVILWAIIKIIVKVYKKIKRNNQTQTQI